MYSNIDVFIEQLKSISKNKWIRNFPRLVIALKKLDSLIGMTQVKDNIISQIKYYLTNKSRNVQGLESHMFHTTILGPPGCGKTSVAEIMAEIWCCIGMFDVQPTQNTTVNKVTENKELEKIKNEKNILAEENANLHDMLNQKINQYNNIKKRIINEQKKLDKVVSIVKKITDKENTGNVNKIVKKINSTISGLNISIMKPIVVIPDILSDLDDEIDIQINTSVVSDKMDSIDEEEEEDFNPLDFIIKLKRDDLIGKYVGHTAIKTREALMKGLNKIIFIDEAYELYNCTTDTSTDSFGTECLNTILNFMNEFSDKCIIIFAGYKDLLQQTIFRIQPGLERRIGFTFEIESYKSDELVKIFEKQLNDKKWTLENDTKINHLFKQNFKFLKHGGGDTLRLTMYTKTIFSNYSFEKLIKGETITSTITYKMVEDAFEILKKNYENQNQKLSEPPPGMYI